LRVYHQGVIKIERKEKSIEAHDEVAVAHGSELLLPIIKILRS